MSKYKIEDLKVGAFFKKGSDKRTIIAVSKTMAIYSFGGVENCVSIDSFLSEKYGELIVPTTKVACVEYWIKPDLNERRCCTKEVWNRGISANSNHKFIGEFEVEVGEDGFPIEEN